MKIINILEARNHFSKLINSALLGEEVIIAKAGKPIAKIIPIKKEKPLRKYGLLEGKIKIAQDFDSPLT